MSVKSAAQENVESAVRDINSAITNLAKVVVEQCWGTDEFKNHYKDALKQSFQQLIEIRDKIQ